MITTKHDTTTNEEMQNYFIAIGHTQQPLPA